MGRDEAELFLREAPTTLLPAAPETLRCMELLGLRTLGHLQRLPRTAMLAQFGREGLYLHRLACGEDREPLELATAPPIVRETLAFSAPATVAPFTWRSNVCCGGSLPDRNVGSAACGRCDLQAAFEEGGSWEQTVTLRRPLERRKRRTTSCGGAGGGVSTGPIVTELSVEWTPARSGCLPTPAARHGGEWRADQLGHGAGPAPRAAAGHPRFADCGGGTLVATTGAAVRAPQLRSLNLPVPVQVCVEPRESAPPCNSARSGGRWRPSSRWRMDDRWWREGEQIGRMYHELELAEGCVETVYQDGLTGNWYRQRYG